MLCVWDYDICAGCATVKQCDLQAYFWSVLCGLPSSFA